MYSQPMVLISDIWGPYGSFAKRTVYTQISSRYLELDHIYLSQATLFHSSSRNVWKSEIHVCQSVHVYSYIYIYIHNFNAKIRSEDAKIQLTMDRYSCRCYITLLSLWANFWGSKFPHPRCRASQKCCQSCAVLCSFDPPAYRQLGLGGVGNSGIGDGGPGVSCWQATQGNKPELVLRPNSLLA